MGYHSGTPDSASLAAQQAAGQTDLVTPAARVAAEALAAGSILGPVTLTATSNASSGSTAVMAKTISLTVNQTGTASGVSTALKVNVTETAALGQVRLLDLQVGGTSRWTILGTAPIQSAADATWDAFNAAAFTQNFKGNTRINSQISKMAIYAPTLASDTATLTIDKAATVYISGPPAAGSNVAITSAAALVVASGRAGFGIDSPTMAIDVVCANVDGIRLLSANAPIFKFHSNSGNAGARNWAFTSQYSADGVFQIMRSAARAGEATTVALSLDANSNLMTGGLVACGASAAKCVVLPNGATAPSGSADMAHLYSADHGGAAASAALALFQEVATVTAGDNTADRYIPATVNGAAVWLLARSSAPS